MYKGKLLFKLILVLTCIASILGVVVFLSEREKEKKTQPSISGIYRQGEGILQVILLPPKETKLLFVGDTMLARTIGQLIKNGKNPFENVKSFFKGYDLVSANLETNISKPGVGSALKGKLYTFNAPLESIKVLKDNNVGVVSLANNHTMDFGANALVDQINNLTNASIVPFGAGKNINEAFSAKIISINNVKLAFIGINDIENWATKAGANSAGSAYFDEGRIKESIQRARQEADIVIIVPHWGIEYNLSVTDRQRNFAHHLIDFGADIIIGAHPHVAEPSEIYKEKFIYYSMGNFVFDEMPSITNADKGYMVEVIVKDKKIISSKPINIKLNSTGFPLLAGN